MVSKILRPDEIATRVNTGIDEERVKIIPWSSSMLRGPGEEEEPAKERRRSNCSQ